MRNLHIENAISFVDMCCSPEGPPTLEIAAMLAQAEATLALAQEMKRANDRAEAEINHPHEW